MYTLVSAIAKPINSQGRWIELSIGNLLMPHLYSTYSKVYATLSNPFLTENVCLDLAEIRAEYGGQSITFNQVLTAVGNNTLPLMDTIPVLNTRYAHFSDAFKAGYKVQAVHPLAAPNTPMPESDKTWLLLTRPDTDYKLLYESCLVSVNGFIHATDYSTDGLYVHQGQHSKHLSGDADLGIYSFRKLGKLSFKPITEDMIYKQDQNQLFKDRVHVNLGMDVSNKTVMLVLGGYLHLLDKKTFYRVSDSSFAIEFNNLSYLNRFYESRKHIDMSSLGLSSTDQNKSLISVVELMSDEVIKKYLCLSQSFFVILDNPEIFKETKKIRATPGAGVYIAYTPPLYPLIGELGRMHNYWYNFEAGQWAITCSNSYRYRHRYWTVDANNASVVDDQSDTTRRRTNDELRYLIVGADI